MQIYVTMAIKNIKPSVSLPWIDLRASLVFLHAKSNQLLEGI